ADVAGQVPVEADGPRVGAGGRAWCREPGRHGAGIDLQGVVAGGDLERAEAARAEAELRPRPDAALGGRLAGQHVRGRDLPRVVGNLFADGVAADGCPGMHPLRIAAQGPEVVEDLRGVPASDAVD